MPKTKYQVTLNGFFKWGKMWCRSEPAGDASTRRLDAKNAELSRTLKGEQTGSNTWDASYPKKQNTESGFLQQLVAGVKQLATHGFAQP